MPTGGCLRPEVVGNAVSRRAGSGGEGVPHRIWESRSGLKNVSDAVSPKGETPRRIRPPSIWKPTENCIRQFFARIPAKRARWGRLYAQSSGRRGHIVRRIGVPCGRLVFGFDGDKPDFIEMAQPVEGRYPFVSAVNKVYRCHQGAKSALYMCPVRQGIRQRFQNAAAL